MAKPKKPKKTSKPKPKAKPKTKAQGKKAAPKGKKPAARSAGAFGGHASSPHHGTL